MDHNISLLEQKLDQLISLLEESRAQNGDLRGRLKTAEARSEQLETQMDAARNKLEQVVAHLPETVSLYERYQSPGRDSVWPGVPAGLPTGTTGCVKRCCIRC